MMKLYVLLLLLLFLTTLTSSQQQSIQPKIAGGTVAQAGVAPWYISPTGETFCGASLIYQDIGLTAAHCDGAFTAGAGVHVGALVRGTTVAGAQPRRVRRALPHPLWRDPNNNQQPTSNPMYDIMLFQLDTPITDITPVVYNTDPNLPVDNEELLVMGFGNTGPDESPTSILRQANLFAIPDDTCEAIYRNLFTDGLSLCAGDPDSGASACPGDSGSPLVSQTTTINNEGDTATAETASVIQYGVVSYGLAGTEQDPINACGNPDIPTVYTRTSAVADWIAAGICALSVNPPDNCADLPTLELPSWAPTPETAVPTPAPLTEDLTFVVQFDGQPEETDFYIVNDKGQVLATRPEGQVINKYARPRYNLQNLPHGSYVFIVTDAGSNGWTAGLVPGFVDIYQLNSDGRLILIAFGQEDFESLLEIPFNVTGNPVQVFKPTETPTAAPTAAPTMTLEPTRFSSVPLSPTGNNNPSPPSPTIGVMPSNSSPSTPSQQDNGDTRDDDTPEEDLLGLGLNEVTNYAIVLAAALFALLVFVLVVRCMCCRGAKEQHSTQGRRNNEFLPY
uniref:Peptidase S1 domain-containing protein n=1 Tax=Amphora coffeiformis TaxID=265554 RepID=A0A7S3L5E3_9STRA